MNASTPVPAGWVVDRRHHLLSAALFTLALLFSLLPPGLEFSRGDWSGVERGLLGAVQWPLLFLGGAWLLFRRYRLALGALREVNLLLPAILCWFLASTLWSLAPDETARRAVRLMALAGCAYAFTLASWRPGRLWELARLTLGLVAAGSVALAVLAPDFGTHPLASPEAGKWRGLTTNKNILGPAAAIGFLLWLHAWAARQASLRQAFPWLVVCAAALLGARSSTSLLAALSCAVILLLYLRLPFDVRGHRTPIAGVVFLLVLLPLHGWIVWHGELTATGLLAPIAELTGKDLTLTGRSEIWRYMLEEIPRRPWLGVGHGAYWLGEWSASNLAVRELYWVPNQGHNFYLDLVNETGFIGLGLFLALLLSWMRTIVRVAAVDRSLAVLNMVLLLFLLVHGFTETVMLRAITPPTVLMFFALFDMNRRLFEDALTRERAARPGGA